MDNGQGPSLSCGLERTEMNGSKKQLHDLAIRCAERFPLWRAAGPMIVRRTGPILQVVGFNASRWNPEVTVFAGFHFLGYESRTIGVSVGDSLRSSAGSPLWVSPDDLETVTAAIVEQVRPHPLLPIDLREAADAVVELALRSGGPGPLLAAFNTALYVGDYSRARAIHEKIATHWPASPLLGSLGEALQSPEEENRARIDATVQEQLETHRLVDMIS